jgi:uncharacterized protein YndB with AHSA1/START domain
MTTTYESIEGRPALRFERRLAHPVAAVWSALTDKPELDRWFPTKIDGELQPDGRLSFSFPHHPQIPDMEGRVTALDPPRELGFYWGEDHLLFELEPAADGAETELRFTVLLGAADKAARDGAGWHTCLAQLEASLDGATDDELEDLHGGWREHYEEYARRGFPATAPIPESA